MGVTALWVKVEVEVSWAELSDTGKGREDEDDVAECPDVDTDRVEKLDGIGWVPDDKPRAGDTMNKGYSHRKRVPSSRI